MLMRRRTVAAVAAGLVLCCAGIANARGTASPAVRPGTNKQLSVGAASVDITPPPWTPASDSAFTPTCGATPALVDSVWTGPRQFAFEEPYIDLYGLGQYAPGDPYCDADHSGHYEAPYLAGGSSDNRWPAHVEAADPLSAEVAVYAIGKQRIATVSIDSIGMFNSAMDLIRADAAQTDPGLKQILISSTHDESAPDPIGLWGPDTQRTPLGQSSPTGTSVSSGYDGFYFRWLAARVARAIAKADAARQPARLKLAMAQIPSNVQSCFSSYPWLDDQLIPIEQAVNSRTGRVIFTLVNANTHVETLAFSNSWAYQTTYTGDWPGFLRQDLQAQWPGSIAMELTGLVGSVETPTVYQPQSTQVVDVPQASLHNVANPDGCHTVYPNPATGTPVTNAVALIRDYGRSLADDVISALATARTFAAGSLKVQHRSVCLQLENNFFAAAFAAGLFGPRPGYADPTCTVGYSYAPGPASPQFAPAAQTHGPPPLYLKTDLAVLTVGPAQFVYLPGEVFPVSAIRGPFDPANEPFPTTCYDPVTANFYCGSTMPMTPWLSADMTAPFKFFAGLGEDMLGYLMPPGNFVGTFPQTATNPWAAYEAQYAQSGDSDRFGHHHSDDTESVGPYAALDLERVVAGMLAQDGRGLRVVPGMFVDASGRLSASPFAAPGFTGAVGVETFGSGKPQRYLIGQQASGWATFDGTRDPGTRGTSLAYSVSTAGVLLKSGQPLLIDVYRGSTIG
ncbi:MAG: hypothetical protein ACYCO3_11770 [Mycobacteriales bacterium]